MEKAHLRNYLDRSTNIADIHAQPEAHWSKSVANGAGQGVAALPPARLGPTLLWRLYGGMQRRFPVVTILPTLNHPTSIIKAKVELSPQLTTFWSQAPHTSHLYS
jgi:hypothetical protein